MKKYAKQIMAWICAMLMTVSMVVPVIADNGGNSNHKNEVYITPMVRNLDFTLDRGNVVGDDGELSLRIEIYNPSPSIDNADIMYRSYTILRESYITLDDGTKCNFIDKAGLNKDKISMYDSRTVSLRINVPDTVADGKYKIESLHLKYGFAPENKPEEVKAEKDINLSDLDNQKELEIVVAKSAEGNYPELLNFAYGNVTNPVIVSGDSSVTALFVMTQKNKVSGEYTKTIKDIQLTFKNNSGSFTTSCQINRVNERFNNDTYEWYPAI